MAIKLADTARPNNHVDSEHLGTFPVAYAEDIWFEDGTRLSEKTFDGQSIQVTELPLASATEEGHVYQYIGTTGTYTHGCFYECVEESGNYDWKILQTVENCVIYTDRNIVDSTVYPFGTVVVYTGEPQWGFFKGHHYMYAENQTLTLYKFNCNYNGTIVSVVFTDKELKVGTTRLRDFDGYIVDYVSEVNGDTATVTNRGGSTEILTDLVFTGETEEITFTGWVDIGGGGSDDGTDYEEFIGTKAEWDALSQSEKNKYDGKIVNITDDEDSSTGVIAEVLNPFTVNANKSAGSLEEKACKQGRIVQFKTYIESFKNIVEGEWNTLGTVTPTIKPFMETPVSLSAGVAATATAYARITTNGELQIWGSSDLNTLSSRFFATYFSAN